MNDKEKPFDRKDVFVRAFRKNYGVLLKSSLTMLIFSLPAVAVLVWCFVELYLLGEITPGNVMQLYTMQSRMYLWLILPFAVLSVGAAGVFYVIRRLVWGEEISFLSDFWKGIKMNAVQSVISGVLFIAFVGALCYGMNTLSLNVQLGSAYWVLLIIQIFLLVVAVLLLLFQYCIIAVYSDSMIKIIKNSFALVFMTLPRGLLTLVAIAAPVALIAMLGSSYLMYLIAVTVMGLVGFGYAILLFTLYAHGAFDKFINKDNFPSIYKKGLYAEKVDAQNEQTDAQDE